MTCTIRQSNRYRPPITLVFCVLHGLYCIKTRQTPSAARAPMNDIHKDQYQTGTDRYEYRRQESVDASYNSVRS